MYILYIIYMNINIYLTPHTFFPFSFGDLRQDVRQRLQLLIQHVKGFAALAQVQQRHAGSTRAKVDVGIAAHRCHETSVHKTNERVSAPCALPTTDCKVTFPLARQC